jgi:TrmH family RNA methyltransferase
MRPIKITSHQNPKVKNTLLLIDKAKERKAQQLIVIEGLKEIEMALQAGMLLKTMFFSSTSSDMKAVNTLILKSNTEVELLDLSEELFAKIAYREGNAHAVALATPRFTTLSDLQLSDSPLVLVVESVEKPGNLGALLRTADAAGIDAVIICDTQTDIYNPNVVRSSLGCVFTNQVVTASSAETVKFLREKGISIYCTALTASVPYHTVDFKKPSAIVMGTEATGLTDFWLEHASQNIIIPMRGKIDSMNVSVSAAITIFEAVRQRLS